MGIPYSREINAAFEQVTPLVAAGFEVLQTTKNIAILLACIQVTTVILLSLILIALFGVICSVNPDLRHERQELVTPVMTWVAGWVFLLRGFYGGVVKWLLRGFVAVLIAGFGLLVWQGSVAGYGVPDVEVDGEGHGQGGEEEEKKGKEKAEEVKKGKDK